MSSSNLCICFVYFNLKEGVLEGEDTYPAVGKTVSRLGFVANYENCVSKKYPIKIKNCGQYYVYYLKPVQGCPSAYCFGMFLKVYVVQLKCITKTSIDVNDYQIYLYVCVSVKYGYEIGLPLRQRSVRVKIKQILTMHFTIRSL